jgi:hypothetical protein
VPQLRDRIPKLLATLDWWVEVDHRAFAGRLARDRCGVTPSDSFELKSGRI